jgi:PHD/YefM family antitoxin component YafN of YafNO toxin-antitoxin module
MAKTLSLNLKDIRSVTDFQRNAKTHVARLKRTKAPMLLTVNGSASVVVQDAATYQRLLDRVDELEYEREFVAAVNEGIADMNAGRSKPFREAFAEMEQRLGIQR